MSSTVFSEILSGLYDNQVIPYLGPGVLFDSKSKIDGRPIPADSESLILAMNGGKPMAPKLMYEFPRAAMNQELKRGRNFLTQFLDKTYGQTKWSRAAVHEWLGNGVPDMWSISIAIPSCKILMLMKSILWLSVWRVSSALISATKSFTMMARLILRSAGTDR